MDKLNVLIVDDDKDTAEFFSVVLGMAGFECKQVFNAKDALAHLAGSQPDLVLLDLRLGLEITGEDILQQIRSNPRFEKTRVVVITAYPALTPPVSNMADLILLKPVDIDQLRTLSGRLVGQEVRPRLEAYRDPITQLFNEELFISRLEHAIERSKRRVDFLFAVILFSVEFQPREATADLESDRSQLLYQVGERMRQSFRPTDTLSRLEDGRFGTLHEELKRAEDIQVLERRLRESMTQPFQIQGRSYHSTLKFSIALGGPHFASAQEMLADIKATF